MTEPPKDPVHEDWEFTTRCLCEQWDDPAQPRLSWTVVNMYPFATELRSWMQQKPERMVLITPEMRTIANPFSHHASILVMTFMEIVNDFHAFVTCPDRMVEPWKIDIRRHRMASEMILYATRICEALFKQMLYCTNIDYRRYWGAALGGLLSARCRACKGKKKHRVSLSGSLAHRYGRCGEYEECLKKDLEVLNDLRNSQAAHATVEQPRISSTVDEAYRIAHWYVIEIGEKFVHMLQHISEIEIAMIDEINHRLYSEDRTGKVESNLVSTYYWELAFEKLYLLLSWRSKQMIAPKSDQFGDSGSSGSV